MNYFKVIGAGVFGKKVAMIEVECVQQRRLPYLQIIGVPSAAAGALRERALAAIESAGIRLPARRFTVSVLGAGTALSGEIDLAVALSLLGSAGFVSRARMDGFLASGALSLDGRLLPLSCRAPLRLFRAENPEAALLLPWEDSQVLGLEGEGGGFRTLVEVVRFLKGSDRRGARSAAEEPLLVKSGEAWRWIEGRPLAQRILPVSAAGGHPLMVLGGEAAAPVAEDLRALLPPLDAQAREEALPLRRAAGESAEERPIRELRADQAGRLLRFDAKLGIFGEISLAHGGVLLVSHLGDKPLSLFRQLREPLESGSIRFFREGRSLSLPADWQLVAAADFCLCGLKEACRCAGADADRWRRKLEDVRSFFPLCYLAEEARGEPAPPCSELWPKVAEARARALARQGRPNNRLRQEDCFRLKPWAEEAIEAWRASRAGSRSQAGLARVALTVSDLRQAREVSRADVMEARLYVPESFVPRSRLGNRRWSGSVPSTKSNAIP